MVRGMGPAGRSADGWPEEDGLGEERPAAGRLPWWRRPWGRAVALAGLCLLFFLGALGYSVVHFVQEVQGVSGAEQGGAGEEGEGSQRLPHERLNVLVMGVDGISSPDTARSDTLFVVSADPVSGEAGLLSIPRDTLVPIAGHGREKITHAHVYGGIPLTRQTVGEFLGVPIHAYVQVDFDGFRRLVDLLGGVTVNVEKRLRYSDPLQDLHIDIPAGEQHLDGETALDFVRYRSDSDLQRIHRQHQFLRAVVARLFDVDMVVRWPQLIQEAATAIETDLDVGEMLALARLAAGQSPDLRMETLPTHPVGSGAGYLGEEADPAEKERLVALLLRGEDPEQNQEVAVRVLNGSGIQGAAGRLSEALAGRGYRTLPPGNATEPASEPALVLYREEAAREAAERLARTLPPEWQPARGVRIEAGEPEQAALFREGDAEADLVVLLGSRQGA